MRTRSMMLLPAAFALAVLAVTATTAGNLVVAPNDPAPAVQGVDLAENLIVVDWSEAKLTVLNFWATWCEPCRKEMPLLQELVDERGEEGLRVLGVVKDVKLAPELIAARVARMGVTYPNLANGRKISRQWGGTGIIPTTYIVGSDGVVIRRYVGGGEEQVAAMLRDIHDYMDDKPLQPPFIAKPREYNSTQ